MHRRNIIYRDIKPENILLDLEGHLKIADFGLAKPNMDESMLAYSFCGSPEYMAPEMLRKNGHNYSVDIYCLGTFLYELVIGIPPFYSTNTKEMFQHILKKNILIPDTINLSPEIKSLLRGLLEKTPEKRLGYKGGIEEIFMHPWCRKANFEAIALKQIEPPFKPNLFEFYFDEVSNQDLLEELDREYDQNITEIYDEEDYSDQLNEFHYVYIDNSKFTQRTSSGNQRNRPQSGNAQNNNIIGNTNNINTVINLASNNNNNNNLIQNDDPTPKNIKTNVQINMKNQLLNDFKSSSSMNFDDFMMVNSVKNLNSNPIKHENAQNNNRLSLEGFKKQISVNFGLNKLKDEKKTEIRGHSSGSTAAILTKEAEKKTQINNNNHHYVHNNYGESNLNFKNFKSQQQALSTKNSTAKHFVFDLKQEGAKTYENIENVGILAKGTSLGSSQSTQQKSLGNYIYKGAVAENPMKK